MAVYIYSITGKDHPLPLDDLKGVGDPPTELRTVTAGPLCAVVSDAPEDLRPKRRDVGAHQEVQQRLMAGGSVLPMRFGYVAEDDDTIRAILEERADDFRARLGALEGCTEYHLKASLDEDAMLRQILSDSPEARQLNDEIRSGSASPQASLELGEMVAREVQEREEALASHVLETLRPSARETDSSPATGEDFISVSFLVTREQEEPFLTAALDVAKQLGDDFDFRLNGPLPPYSFV
ncbi:GvpL/GvpF family gas vesicle protein [Streptomyces sp. NPDC002004]